MFRLYNKEDGSEKQAGVCSICGMMCYGRIKDGQYTCMKCLIPSREKQQDPLFDQKYQNHLKKERRKKAKEKENRDDWFVPKDKFFGE